MTLQLPVADMPISMASSPTGSVLSAASDTVIMASQEFSSSYYAATNNHDSKKIACDNSSHGFVAHDEAEAGARSTAFRLPSIPAGGSLSSISTSPNTTIQDSNTMDQLPNLPCNDEIAPSNLGTSPESVRPTMHHEEPATALAKCSEPEPEPEPETELSHSNFPTSSESRRAQARAARATASAAATSAVLIANVDRPTPQFDHQEQAAGEVTTAATVSEGKQRVQSPTGESDVAALRSALEGLGRFRGPGSAPSVLAPAAAPVAIKAEPSTSTSAQKLEPVSSQPAEPSQAELRRLRMARFGGS
eukprot:SAG31_NODE_2573_length_5458_cov_1.552528_4_plen_305_part_00